MPQEAYWLLLEDCQDVRTGGGGGLDAPRPNWQQDDCHPSSEDQAESHMEKYNALKRKPQQDKFCEVTSKWYSSNRYLS